MKASFPAAGIAAAALVAGVAIAAAAGAGVAWAHEGEDHSRAEPATVGAAAARAGSAGSSSGSVDTASPHRTSDGSVFVPKPTQYRIGLRTRAVEPASLAVTVELSGKVVAEPNAGGLVQSTQTGRIEPGPKGLPVLGQRVTRGDVLAFVAPAIASLERANLLAGLAALDAQIAVARSRVARYAQLEGSVARKDIEAARIELQSLQSRRDVAAKGLAARESLRAPVSGVVSASAIRAGQVVEPSEVLVEIVDPARLAIEALAYDPSVASAITGGSATVGAVPLALQLVGAGRQLRGQALPLLFRAKTAGVPLAIGQPVQVVARTGAQREGFAVPRSALVRERSGENVVWVHEDAERFVARRVAFESLDADTIVVSSGLSAGDRVVVSAANLLAQVR